MNTNAHTKARKKLVVTPAAETRMSPRLKLRNFLELTGTGLAPPNVYWPFDANQSTAGSSRLMTGSMCGIGLRVTRPRV